MEKQQEIITMFNDIAKTYDLANRILSMGVDKSWRRKACDLAFGFYDKDEVAKIVDVACGTGDMMIDWQNGALRNDIKLLEIAGIDPSTGMMEVGKQKIPNGVFIEAGAENLPLEDNSVDIISITYGIRNVVKRKEAWDEFARVLKPGGLVVILEFTKNKKESFTDHLTHFYLKNIMPTIGGLISKNKEAYTYLTDSIEDFITTEELSNELELANLKPIYIKGFSMDISTLFIARKG
ncbi:bifunctional demethylmenaquinone methyltransferase/2-methoxy-6-polyprenyl-1,4-benzoquinol methylase UbiE [Arcobacter sp. FWKO B]|uniref:bifunctional demethylmenaquinone methyltransferase/2-methoxy-6-polyprenyl-1,4-benzoquinol methylase UbiE n=1 Tax=Arcobacter sp. FWKO B TaxID=2593672 RepID=UPI0018A38246|nr:bifunctional demethylmenaquinone methyltransferase/2-methoxy-6-polyprenyl-1,4-benzoquinol methylase UbiE [Arcobacter sp. FWKO B]QOG12749.1 bifunctional demethylmenaquinone methyltransferase/2-methoxy-6-polyprenyl-1,4-benzoquinol methylase UbiE [Arcobacter sp. FWKO B]